MDRQRSGRYADDEHWQPRAAATRLQAAARGHLVRRRFPLFRARAPLRAAPPRTTRVQLKAVGGGAPRLRRAKFIAGSTESVATIGRFLRAQLALADEAPLWLYVGGGGGGGAGPPWTPSPDDTLGELARGGEAELVLSYSTAPGGAFA